MRELRPMLEEMVDNIAPETLEEIDVVLRGVGFDLGLGGLPLGAKLHVLANAYAACCGED